MQIITKKDLLEIMASLLTFEDMDLKISMKEIDVFSKNKKKLYMNTAKYSGFNATVEATKIIINNYYANQFNIGNAVSVMIHYKVKSKTPISELMDGMRIIKDEISVGADIYMGISYFDNFQKNYAEATIIL